MYTIPEHVVPLLDSAIYSAFAQLPNGYDMSMMRPGFNDIHEQRQHAVKMLQMVKHLQGGSPKTASKHTEAVMHWERMSKTLKMLEFIDE
jgi:hypothetical protein